MELWTIENRVQLHISANKAFSSKFLSISKRAVRKTFAIQ